MKTLVAWSSGKDSAFLLAELRRRDDVEVAGLVTTVEAGNGRVTTHGTPAELLKAQAEALALPVLPIPIPWPCPNDEYEAAWASTLERARGDGVEAVAFGDLHLEDVRSYREALFEERNVRPLFPLWGRSTAELAREMTASGVQARVVLVDREQLPRTFLGRAFSGDFLDDLPGEADPCGENGEFHTFVWDGPGFTRPVPFEVLDVYERQGFVGERLGASSPSP